MANILHGSAVAIGGNGVLLLGPSGSGKSDLALRLIDRGAKLICDDILHMEHNNSLPQLAYAPNIAGKIEVRGIGICKVEFLPSAPLRLIVQLTRDVDRMPPEHQSINIDGF
jgi:HPr kinase/phosphorylase